MKIGASLRAMMLIRLQKTGALLRDKEVSWKLLEGDLKLV